MGPLRAMIKCLNWTQYSKKAGLTAFITRKTQMCCKVPKNKVKNLISEFVNFSILKAASEVGLLKREYFILRYCIFHDDLRIIPYYLTIMIKICIFQFIFFYC